VNNKSQNATQAGASNADQRQTSWIDFHVGRRVEACRKSRKMSRRQLAEACQITQRQLVKYESGVNRITVSRLYQISVVLGVAISEFFSADQMMLQGSNDVDRLVSGFLSIVDAGGRQEVMSLVERLAQPTPGTMVAGVSPPKSEP
jgi:transcriptional regulator with XRE-family HTH domain